MLLSLCLCEQIPFNRFRGALRVLLWGALAMAATALIGHLAGTTV